MRSPCTRLHVLATNRAFLKAGGYTPSHTAGAVRPVQRPGRFPANSVHARLAGLSPRAHELAARLADDPNDERAKRELAKVQDEVDRAAAELWGLTDAELEEIRKALELLK
jgi:hypothetical protein